LAAACGLALTVLLSSFAFLHCFTAVVQQDMLCMSFIVAFEKTFWFYYQVHVFLNALFLFTAEEETLSTSVTNGHDKSVACQVALQRLLEPLIQQQLNNSRTLTKLSEKVTSIENEVHQVMRSQTVMNTGWRGISARDVVIVLVAVLVQIFILIYLRK
jgi:hypothetical protein